MKNIAHILENCPKGTKLYSPLCGECELHMIDNDTITCSFGKNLYHICFDIYGHYKIAAYKNSECLLFPSKENRDWDKFNPFKDGDIIYVKSNDDYGTVLISIYKGEDSLLFYDYCSVSLDKGYFYIGNIYGLIHTNKIGVIRFATEDEKRKLFDAIKENGYNWNSEKKILEKLIEPTFKVGDTITNGDVTSVIKQITKDSYILDIKDDDICFNYVFFKDQDKWKLIPNKFDIGTLVPFESKVLVRDVDHNEWEGAIFGRYDGKAFFTIGGLDWRYCIPYEGNEHLFGTTNECDEYYKNW